MGSARTVIDQRRPKRIGINELAMIPFGDGLTAGLKEKLVDALDSHAASRLESAEHVALEVFDRRTSREMEAYEEVVLLTRAIIREAFSLKLIRPGVTSTDEVRWWMQQRTVDLGLGRMSNGSVSVLRRAVGDSGIQITVHHGMK